MAEFDDFSDVFFNERTVEEWNVLQAQLGLSGHELVSAITSMGTMIFTVLAESITRSEGEPGITIRFHSGTTPASPIIESQFHTLSELLEPAKKDRT